MHVFNFHGIVVVVMLINDVGISIAIEGGQSTSNKISFFCEGDQKLVIPPIELFRCMEVCMCVPMSV